MSVGTWGQEGGGNCPIPPDFDRSINSITTRGWGQIIAITLILALSDFQILLRPSMSDSGFLILDDSLHCSTASKADVRWN